MPKAGASAKSRLAGLIKKLRVYHGTPNAPPVRDPYLLILWEQVAYLADDAQRLAAYRLLEKSVGTSPDAVAAAPVGSLRAVARRGGSIGVPQRAGRMRAVAERVLDKWDGKLRRVLKLPFADARRELTKYPSIGEAGAERILLLCGASSVLGLESNAVRVLLRLGYGRDTKAWPKTYRNVQTAASAELPAAVVVRRTAMLLLRQHGQTLCRRSAPRCGPCPLRPDCPTGKLNT